MSTEWTREEVKQAYDAVLRKAVTDREFRNLVLDDPGAAIAQVSGKELPEGYALKIIERDPGVDAVFVLPDFRGEELSEEELEQVAGGDDRCSDYYKCWPAECPEACMLGTL